MMLVHPEMLESVLPEELQSLERWLCWQAQPVEGDKPRKVPVRADMKGNASSTDPKTWSTFQLALQRVRSGWLKDGGIGIVLGHGLAGIDLDNVRDAVTGSMLPWAQALVDMMKRAGAYVEVSPSGKGVHGLLWLQREPDWRHNVPHPEGGSIECYWSGRYFTVTGDALNVPSAVGTLAPEGELSRALEAHLGRRQPAERVQPRVHAPVAANGCTPYGARALQGECDAMRSAPQGTRNEQLNRGAFALAQLAAGGEIDAAQAQAQLEDAARAAGLGDAEIHGTMRSGWEAGLREPRSAPEEQRVQLAGRAAIVEPKPSEPVRMTAEHVRERIRQAQESNAASQGWAHQGISVPQYPALTDALDGVKGWCLLTGGTGVGKTTWTLAASLSVAMRGRMGEGAHAGGIAPTTQGTQDGMRSAVADVVYLSTEMTWTEQYHAMVCMLAGVWVRDYAKRRAHLPMESRAALDRAERTLGELMEGGRLLLLSAADVQWHGWQRHALEGVERVVLEHAQGKRVLVVVDTLHTLPVEPAPGTYGGIDDFERDKLVVEGCTALRHELEGQMGALLTVAEEAKHLEGSGDMHSTRGSSAYAYRTSQRLALVRADSAGRSRHQGVRIGHPGTNASEVDMLVGKARQGGHAGAVVPMVHAYTQSRVVELEPREMVGARDSRSYWTASELEAARRTPDAVSARKQRRQMEKDE